MLSSHSFIFAYQDKTVEHKTIEALKKCQVPSQLATILDPFDLEAKPYDKNTTFVFSKNSKLESYITLKQKLMDYFIEVGAGMVSKPWDKVHLANELPKYWQNEVNIRTMTSSNTRVNQSAPIVPVLLCKLSLRVGDKEVSTRISLARNVPKSINTKIESQAMIEGGVSDKEKRFPATLEDAVAEFPYVSYTLNGLVTKTWGYPIANSDAAKVLEAYFKELRLRTESTEEKLRQLYREFFKKLQGQDPVWKELSDLNGKPANSMSKALFSLVETNLDAEPGNLFFDKVDLLRFLNQSKVVKINPVIEIDVAKLNHNGSIGFIGLIF